MAIQTIPIKHSETLKFISDVIPGPETGQFVGFPVCLVPFLSLPCSSTHQHVSNTARHWISTKLPSLLHLGTALMSSKWRCCISRRLYSHFVRAAKWNMTIVSNLWFSHSLHQRPRFILSSSRQLQAFEQAQSAQTDLNIRRTTRSS